MAEETANQVVLVVEDDDSIREIVSRVLEDEGYVTHTANNGVRGLEQFYLKLYGVTARPRLVGLIARLRQEVARSLRWKLVQHSPSHHDIFFDAVKNGDADLAAAELASHYRKVVALLRRFLREAKEQQAPRR